jgi:phospholipid:diacylglycerol acyltransferase
MAGTLRRRGQTANPPRSESSPLPAEANSNNEGAKESDKTPAVKVIHHHPPRTRKRKTTAIFLLGSLFGIIAAGFFAKSNDLIDFPEIGELSMDSFLDVLPAGLVKDMREMVVGPGSPDPLQSFLDKQC